MSTDLIESIQKIRKLEKFLRKRGITKGELCVLSYLAETPLRQLREKAHSRGRTANPDSLRSHSYIEEKLNLYTNHIPNLEKKGYIKILRHEGDSRKRFLKITGKGKYAYQVAKKEWEELFDNQE